MKVRRHFALNLIVGFTWLNGKPVGIVAQQSAYMAGIRVTRPKLTRALEMLKNLSDSSRPQKKDDNIPL